MNLEKNLFTQSTIGENYNWTLYIYRKSSWRLKKYRLLIITLLMEDVYKAGKKKNKSDESK